MSAMKSNNCNNFFEIYEKEAKTLRSYYDEEKYNLSPSINSEESENNNPYMFDLVNKIYKEEIPSSTSIKETNSMKNEDNSQKLYPNSIPLEDGSEFSSSLVKSSNVKMDELLQGISDTKGFYSVKKGIFSIISAPSIFPDKAPKIETTKVPESRLVSARSKRKKHYLDQSNEISRWIDKVKSNRESENLDFRPKYCPHITRDHLIGKFAPSTIFEKEMYEVLDKDYTTQNKQFKILNISRNNDRDKRNQLAKTRALMFYERQRSRHIKKIKSKKYRNIRKKQRIRDKDVDHKESDKGNPKLSKLMEEKYNTQYTKYPITIEQKNASRRFKKLPPRPISGNISCYKYQNSDLKITNELENGTTDICSGEVTIKNKVVTCVNLEDSFPLKIVNSSKNKLKKSDQSPIRKLPTLSKTSNAPKIRKKEDVLLSQVKVTDSGFIGNLNIETSNTLSNTKRNLSTTNNSNFKRMFEKSQSFINYTKGQKSDISKDDFLLSFPEKNDELNEILSPFHYETKVNLQTTPSSIDRKIAVPKRWFNDGNNKISSSDFRKSAGTKITDPIKNNLCLEYHKHQHFPNNQNFEKNILACTQEELVKNAFMISLDSEVDEAFKEEKLAMSDQINCKKEITEHDTRLVGWNSWIGDGLKSCKHIQNAPKISERNSYKGTVKSEDKINIIINKKRNKSNAKFQLENVPYPYASRMQYEQSMINSIGQEWNVRGSVKEMTIPRVHFKMGKIIQPIHPKVKTPRTVRSKS